MPLLTLIHKQDQVEMVGWLQKKKHKEKLALWRPDKLDPRCELIANEHVIKRFDLLEETLTKLKIEK